MAMKMQAVVDREQALYNREKAERRDALKAEKAASEEIQVKFEEDQDDVHYRPMTGAK
jgi:hypothetical protein